jgi:hypothetical protein
MSIPRKLSVLAGIGVASVLVLAAPAAAQDCVVVHRSTQGAVGASHSTRWVLLDVNQLLGGGCISPTELAKVDSALTQAGLPLVFDTRSNKVLPSNGHGIVHIEDTYIPIILNAAPDAGPCLGGP